MKSCKGCKYAEWKKTATGRLHPSGDGQCTFEWRCPPIPACSYWMNDKPPAPYGRHISRHRDNGTHCTYFNRGEP